MAFVPFIEYFPRLGERETRSLIIEPVDADAQEQMESYALFDSYCDDPGCDCRCVKINVYSMQQQRLVTTIHYGWEDEGFYTRWMHGDRKTARRMVGASIDLLHPQTEEAQRFLELFKTIVENDPAYEARLREHYRMMRAAVDSGPEPGDAKSSRVTGRVPRRALMDRALNTRKPSRNAPCPCGSGRKYKSCCGRSLASA